MQRGTGPVTQWLIAINVIVFVIANIELTLSGGFSWIYTLLTLQYSLVLQGWVWQLFTAMFMHAPLIDNPFHILFNMFALWQYGSLNERLYSHKQYLAIYLGAGL